MDFFKGFKKFLKVIYSKKVRLIFVISLFLFLVTIPSRLIYNFPIFEKKPPIVKHIDIDIPTPQSYPINVNNIDAPYLSARSVIVVDVDSKAVIYQKNPDEKLAPASTTKMLTALLALNQYDMQKVASISSPIWEGQVMFLEKDENIKYINLIKGLLIHSANDAAQALADLDPDGYDSFIAKMNKMVREFNLYDTHFSNPAGLSNGKHFSTVHDLAIIGAHVIANPVLAEIVATETEVVTDESGEIIHELIAINELLGIVPGLRGIKTGWTEDAGECLVAYTERDGHKIITALLGSYDRFGETTRLVEWVFANHQWQEIDISKVY
jgi:serine-type D-Ala-D-Ala carboxypeptidase (penicillin-binding protein 5/6)